MKKASLIVLILFFSVSVEAQIKFNSSVETGINLTALPHTFYKDSNEKLSESSFPGLVLGYSMNTFIGNHFVFSLGTQYRKMNNDFHVHSEYGGYITDYHKKEHYSKISFPLTAGIQFGKRLHPTILFGAEMNCMLSGKINSERYFSNATESEFNNESRWRGQGIVGFSISTSKHFQVGTALHIGGPIEGIFHSPASTIYTVCISPASAMYLNHEFSISVKYFFKELYNSPPKKTLE